MDFESSWDFWSAIIVWELWMRALRLIPISAMPRGLYYALSIVRYRKWEANPRLDCQHVEVCRYGTAVQWRHILE